MVDLWRRWASEPDADKMTPLLFYSPSAESLGSSCTRTPPPSFKVGKHRKTQQFIGEERKRTQSGENEFLSQRVGLASNGGAPEESLLAYDEDSLRIHAMVASLIVRYVAEGDATQRQQLPSDDEFHEEHFLRRWRWCSRCCPWSVDAGIVRKPTTEDMVCTLISDVANALFFCNQVIVLSAVYIERLITVDGAGSRNRMLLTSTNWRPILAAALLVASKVFEDVHPWNADFEACLFEVAGMRCRRGSLTDLETRFLSRIGWRVFVDGELYAAYFFSLIGESNGNASQGGSKLSRRRGRRPMHLTWAPAAAHSAVNDTGYGRCSGAAIPEGDEGCPQSDGEVDSQSASPLTCEKIFARTMTDPAAKARAGEENAQSRPLRSLQRAYGVAHHQLTEISPRQIRSAWELDAGNPLIGTLRHAPPALAPSRHIENSEERLLTHELTARTADVFCAPLSPRFKAGKHRRLHRISVDATDAAGEEGPAVCTISGATGARLAAELHLHLSATSCKGGPVAAPVPGGACTAGSGGRPGATISANGGTAVGSTPAGIDPPVGDVRGFNFVPRSAISAPSVVQTWAGSISYKPPSLAELPFLAASPAGAVPGPNASI